MVKDHRPVNLSIRTIRFPVTAIVSILHRISGAFLFCLIPLVLLSLTYSLKSVNDFAYVQSIFSHAIPKLLIWLLLTALSYHFFAGIRHLLMDIGIGEGLPSARFSAWLVHFIGFVLFVLIGVWLWI